jgi:hypothetical protein
VNTSYTVHGDRQHPFGSRATVRKPRESRRSSGPGLCVPALRLVCRFEDEDTAGPSSTIRGNCPSFDRVPVGRENGLPKTSVKEEKLSPGGRPLVATARPMGSLGRSRPMSITEEIVRKELQSVVVRRHTYCQFDVLVGDYGFATVPRNEAVETNLRLDRPSIVSVDC